MTPRLMAKPDSDGGSVSAVSSAGTGAVGNVVGGSSRAGSGALEQPANVSKTAQTIFGAPETRMKPSGTHYLPHRIARKPGQTSKKVANPASGRMRALG